MGRPRHPDIKRLQYGLTPAVYVVEFTGEVVKVGRTTSPRTRLEVLTDYARRNMGLEVVRVYVNHQAESVARAVETRCLERIGLVANRLGKAREFFTGISFDAAVSIVDEESRSPLPA